MARITVDGITHEVRDGQNLLHACLSLGLNLPYFCWHPAMGSVGACRQCAVKQFKDEKDTKGTLVMACMTPAADGARIAIEDPEAREFRASVAEWMMLNHPHDCPVCDEGGECHLQDMVVMTGHAYRGYRGPKRTFRNQDLGPFINHEMNRCIQCYRCLRFYRDLAGGTDFGVFGSRNQVYFGRATDGVLESEFSGNLVEICPTGVFDDKSLMNHYTRKWDLGTAPSVCVHCSLGCNTIPGERYGRLRRIRNRYNGAVNGYFLCDRGRYGYEFVESERRIRTPLLRDAAGQHPAGKAEAMAMATALLRDGARVIGIGSPRASLEANFALRELVGRERFFLGVGRREARLVAAVVALLRAGPARTPSLHEVESADGVLVLGEDPTATAPMLAFALRQSTRQRSFEIARDKGLAPWLDAGVRDAAAGELTPLFIASTDATRLDDVAAAAWRAAPDDIARLGFAVAHALDPDAPAVLELDGEAADLAARIASALRSARRPLVVAGTASASEAVLQAAASVASALSSRERPGWLFLTAPECNSVGLSLLEGGSFDKAIALVRSGGADTTVVLENDLTRRASEADALAFLEAVPHLLVIDHVRTPTTSRAELVLPAGTFAESSGTLVNNEGRAQRFFQVLPPKGDVQPSWRWLEEMGAAAGRAPARRWTSLDAVTAACAAAEPALAGIVSAAPPASFRIDGLRIPRERHRASGRTAALANVTVHEPKPPDDPDSALAFSMEGYPLQPPAPLLPAFRAPGWNSVQALNRFQEEVAGPLRGGDPGVRLIEPGRVAERRFSGAVPPSRVPEAGKWLLVPAHHTFGSEELSALAPGVAMLSPSPYVGLNPADAQELGIAEGDEAEIVAVGATFRLPVRLRPAVPRRLVALPVGLPGVPFVELPVAASLGRAR